MWILAGVIFGVWGGLLWGSTRQVLLPAVAVVAGLFLFESNSLIGGIGLWVMWFGANDALPAARRRRWQFRVAVVIVGCLGIAGLAFGEAKQIGIITALGALLILLPPLINLAMTTGWRRGDIVPVLFVGLGLGLMVCAILMDMGVLHAILFNQYYWFRILGNLGSVFILTGNFGANVIAESTSPKD